MSNREKIGHTHASPTVRRAWGSVLACSLLVLVLVIGFSACNRLAQGSSGLALDGSPSAARATDGENPGWAVAEAHATGTLEASALAVHVTGAVRTPGLYLLDNGSRVADAIDAAGGLRKKADARSINLARPLVDGEQILVLEEGEQPGVGSSVSGTAPGDASAQQLSVTVQTQPININTATLDQLMELPKVGPAIGQRIIDYRAQVGGFGSIEELNNVSGIGEKTFAGLRDLITVG